MQLICCMGKWHLADNSDCLASFASCITVFPSNCWNRAAAKAVNSPHYPVKMMWTSHCNVNFLPSFCQMMFSSFLQKNRAVAPPKCKCPVWPSQWQSTLRRAVPWPRLQLDSKRFLNCSLLWILAFPLQLQGIISISIKDSPIPSVVKVI